jgi:hypothetical protein
MYDTTHTARVALATPEILGQLNARSCRPTGKYGGDLRQAHLPDEQVILGQRAQRVRSIKTE